MDYSKPFIHLFETQGGKYIFDVNTNMIIKTKNETFSLLERLLNSNNENNNTELFNEYGNNKDIKKLKSCRFLSSKKVKEIEHPYGDILEYYMSNNLSMVILQLTQQCNLRCLYCTYSGSYTNRTHKNVRMNFETVKKGIEFLIDNSKDKDEICIGFYGGEPLLEFELMKKSILYTKQITEGKETYFSFTTNGTLFTKDIIEFLMLHDVHIVISLDGPKEIHDKNRKFAVSGCGTFEQVVKNLEFFKENYPQTKIAFNTVLTGKLISIVLMNFSYHDKYKRLHAIAYGRSI